MKIYVAGPMRGIPEFNFPAFHAAAAKLRAEGHEVFSPAENDLSKFGIQPNAGGDERKLAGDLGMTELELRRAVFTDDFTWICKHADAVALLPGWENSKGATAERAVAEALGLQIIELGVRHFEDVGFVSGTGYLAA